MSNVIERVKKKAIYNIFSREYIDYAMSVITDRALPNIKDGLKPVHLRILYSMNELGLAPEKPYMKSARTVGDVLGKYHPHGDSSVYGAMVTMAQDFNTRYPLVDGHGNWGSIDGDNAAAMRYTEAKLTAYGQLMLLDMNKSIVDFVPNYDGKELEPKELGCLIPNLLCNGAEGIAVGMATKIPPHNIIEVYNAINYVIDKTLQGEDYTIEELMQYITAPDFPTGAQIIHSKGISDMYTTGRGTFTMRAVCEIETEKGRDSIVVTELPYKVNKANLIANIADLAKDNSTSNKDKKNTAVLADVKEVRDESDRDGMRIVIELKKDANPNVILNILYKHTALQKNYSGNMLALMDKEPRQVNLKVIIDSFLEHAASVIMRRTQNDYDKASKRLNLVKGILKVITEKPVLDYVISIIRESDDPVKDLLEKPYNDNPEYTLNEEQATHIFDMKLRVLAKSSVSKYEEEEKDLEKWISKWYDILHDDIVLLNTMKEDFLKLKGILGDERRTEIVYEDGSINEEDLVKDENLIVTLSTDNLIKCVEEAEYKAQKRGGKGVKATNTTEDSVIKTMLTLHSKDDICFLSDLGKCHTLKAYKIPKTSRIAKGKSINNYLNLLPGEKIVSMLSADKNNKEQSLLLITHNGIIKRLSLDQLSTRMSVTKVIDFNDGDNLVSGCIVDDNSEVIIVSSLGKSIHISMKTTGGDDQIRPMGRSARGVKAMKLAEGDFVVDMVQVKPDETLLTICSNGYGKRSNVSEFTIQGRGGSGLIAHKINEKTGSLIGTLTVSEDMELFIISAQGQIVRIDPNAISNLGRSTSGVRLINLNEGDQVVSMSKLEREKGEADTSDSSEPVSAD